jgi:hypothetical protein
MLDCLIGYIGLRSEGGTADSGLYLDSLPDINISNTQKITDLDQSSYEEVFSAVEKRTILKFRTFFISEFNKCHRLFDRSVVDCLICGNKELLAESIWYLMGAEMLQERLGSNRINRHTTVDRKKTRELQDDFLNYFYEQLHTAVLGINLSESDCLKDENLECGGTVFFNEFTP